MKREYRGGVPRLRHDTICDGTDFAALIAETGMSYQHVAAALGITSRMLESWLYGHTPTPLIAILAVKYLACGTPARTRGADDARSFSPPG